MAQTKIKRFYYRSGQLFLEEQYVGGQYHGTVRTWHKNGKLASQETYRNGLCHGVAKQWDDQGRLLGSCRMNQGTGISCHWHQNGKLLSETSLYRGTFTGLCRSWIGDGTLVSKTWYLDNQKVTNRRYEAARARNKKFPRIKENGKRPLRDKLLAERRTNLVFVKWLRRRPTSRLALDWLNDTRIKAKRRFGHFRSTKSAVSFVTELISAGAQNVVAAEIYGFPGKAQFCDYLVLQMPESPKEHHKVLRLCRRAARKYRITLLPNVDLEQEEVVLFLAT